MATESHWCGQDKDRQQKKTKIEKELNEIRENMERLALKIQ
jgi:hypothetical protein